MSKPRLEVLENLFDIHRLKPDSKIPETLLLTQFYWISRTPEEITIVCDQNITVNSSECSRGWSAIKVEGKLDFSLTGIISEIASALGSAGISLFSLSTYDTDYFLVKSSRLQDSINALINSGYIFRT